MAFFVLLHLVILQLVISTKMNYVSAENLSKSYGIKNLFQGITFHINEGEKIALVAKNGSGKSTLLKIIMGKEIPDEGTVQINKDVTVVLFDQEISFDKSHTVFQYMMGLDSPPINALREYLDAIESKDEKRMENVIHQMETQKAWDLETEMKQILSQLEIHDLSSKMNTLSGGQLKRVALAKLLTETRAEHRHVLLIMDEPTNHLDVSMVEWLENYLSKANLTLLLVTHDRYFLDSVCDTIWEIEDGSLYSHKGGYASYLENKMNREQNMLSVIDKAQNLYRKELDWMRRQPKARTTKSKSRIDRFYDTEKIAKSSLKQESLEIDFKMQRLGKKILEAKNLNKAFGDKTILSDFSYEFQRGEKIGIIGQNGTGKSTLLNILQGKEPFDSGSIEVGETIQFGYFSQKGLDFNPEERVIDHVKEIAENFPLSNGKTLSASQFLRLFLFDDHLQYTSIGKLSGGEKRRLHLLEVLFRNPNFLIFDEPTNDLDLPTLSILENFLIQFPGTLLVVSHDRYFMDRVCDHLLVFEGSGKVKYFAQNFSTYREQKKIEQSPTTTEIKKEQPSPKSSENSSRKLSYKENRELTEIEEKIPMLEEKKSKLVEKLNGETDYETIAELSTDLQEIDSLLDAYELRWLELQEKIQ